jgi:hypothetical protein
VEKLEQMGKVGADYVAQHHNAALEASKLVALFQAYRLDHATGGEAK